MKDIVLLGASGSIGIQTIDIVKRNSDKFNIKAISIGYNTDLLLEILNTITVNHVYMIDRSSDIELKYPNINFYYGDNGIIEMLKNVEYDLLVNALVGFVGLKPTLYAINTGHDIALANKETLVVAGEFVNKAAKENNIRILPIDSEHSAIFQALQGNSLQEVNKLIITASGGAFRNKTREELIDVTIEDALNHPNWSMGAKITIDSATMMNKGFEVIEAHWLFNIPYENIEVIIHEQSIIHSLVEYQDSSQIAQLGLSDMRIPIQYALSYPNRIKLDTDKLSLASLKQLTFREVDYKRFPLLKIAYEVGKAKGNAPCILNAANEIANKAFLSNKISFLDIEKYIIDALTNIEYQKDCTLDDIYKYDQLTRDYVNERINNI